MTVPVHSFGLEKFGRKVIKKNKSLVDDVEALQKRVTDKKASGEGVKKELARLRSSVVACDGLAAKLPESEKSSQVSRAEVAFLE